MVILFCLLSILHQRFSLERRSRKFWKQITDKWKQTFKGNLRFSEKSLGF